MRISYFRLPRTSITRQQGRSSGCRPRIGQPQGLLRAVSLTLLLSFVWTFTMAPLALAAKGQTASIGASKHVVTPMTAAELGRRIALAQQAATRHMAQGVKGKKSALPSLQDFLRHDEAVRQNAARHPQAVSADSSVLKSPATLLDDVGRLATPIPAAQVVGWTRELHSGTAVPRRAATLHLWLGEYLLAHNEDPHQASWHWRLAQNIIYPSGLPSKSHTVDPLYGLAAYDHAMALFYEGAYQDAADAFLDLDKQGTALTGYDRGHCALWLRHAAACAGYHDERARMGIPEPPRLDPLCGVAALATCLKSLSLPYDRALLLKNCRVTGEGNNLQDIVNAGPKLGVTVRPLSSTDEGLRELPKPLVAYIEHDHFVAVVRADQKGVSYLCSDCGVWPGGRVDVTWKQWDALNPSIYASVNKPGSYWDRVLAAKASGKSGIEVAASLPTTGILAGRSHPVVPYLHPMPLLRGVKVGWFLLTANECVSKLSSLRCATCRTCCWWDAMGFRGGLRGGGLRGGGKFGSSGPSAGDPVNLSTGEEEYRPQADLTVYNPHGPSVSWGRVYDSLDSTRVEDTDYGSGWSHTYNVGVFFGNSIILDNGAVVKFHQTDYPTAANPRIACPVDSGTPLIVEADYSSGGEYYTITFPDRTRWVTRNFSDSYPQHFLTPLAQIIDRNGNAINFNYSPALLLSSITDRDNQPLLTISRNSSNTISAITDRYGRSVYYHVGTYSSHGDNPQELDYVSQIVPSCSQNPPARFVYGYQQVIYTSQFLHSITVPSPAGNNAVSTSYIWYDSTQFVSYLQDSNGNKHIYTSVDASGNPSATGNYTQVKYYNGRTGATDYSYTVGYDSNMNRTSCMDGAGRQIVKMDYSDTNDPCRPSRVTDGNQNITTYSWDPYHNLHQKTSPRGTVTNYTYAFPSGQVPSVINSVVATGAGFVLGELTSVQEGSKTPTNYTYDHTDGYLDSTNTFIPCGLVTSIASPTPSSVSGNGSQVVTAFTYDLTNQGSKVMGSLGLGNLVSVKAPGNYATIVGGVDQGITTSFTYTGDGTSITSPSIGKPLAVTDNLGHTTHLRYDAQGQTTAVIDALGNETDSTYNENGGSVSLGNQLQSVTLPATGQTGTGHGGAANVYLYPGGPLLSTTTYDENTTPHAIRQVTTTYGPEGETLSVSGSTEPVSYTYDALYRLSTLTDGGGHITHYYYDAAGYLDTVTYPGYSGPAPAYNTGNGTWDNVFGTDSIRFPAYDADGNLLSRVDGRGQITSYNYADPESLLTGITYPSGTIGSVSLGYDSYGRRSTMSDGTGSQTYTYDDANDLTQKIVTWTGLSAKTINYAFYANGSRATMTADGQAFSYGYDAAGRMTGMVNPFSELTVWAYRSNNWLQTKTVSPSLSGTVSATTYTQNALGELTELSNQNGSGATLSDYGNMAYDGAGNRTTLTASVPAASSYTGTTNYTYDYGQTANPALSRSQVTGESSTRGGTYANIFSYDGGTSTGPGNPTSFKGATNTFSADNQVTNTGYGYDGAGNPTTYKTNTLTFDPENRMTSYAGTVQTDGYSGDGLRAWKQTSAVRTYFLYDGSQPVGEYSSAGALTAINTFGADGLISRHITSGSVFYTFDERGSVSQRLTSSGTVASSDLYDSYGARNSTGGADVWGFEAQVGYYSDSETGLVLCTHRFYDTSTGRWVTPDPAGYRGGVNQYGYVGNDPNNRLDPSGLWSVTITGGVIGIFGPVLGLGGGADAGFSIGDQGIEFIADGYVGVGSGIGYSFGPAVGGSLDPQAPAAGFSPFGTVSGFAAFGAGLGAAYTGPPPGCGLGGPQGWRGKGGGGFGWGVLEGGGTMWNSNPLTWSDIGTYINNLWQSFKGEFSL